jgi:hypothetical protein
MITKKPKRPNGQGLVEFALVIPVILLLLFGIFDLGRAVYAYSTIANAARQASRLAIVNQDLVPIQDKAVYESVALGLQPGDVLVIYCNSGQLCESDPAEKCPPPIDIGCDAVVTVEYTYSPATPALSALVGSLILSSTSRLAVERTLGDGATNP